MWPVYTRGPRNKITKVGNVQGLHHISALGAASRRRRKTEKAQPVADGTSSAPTCRQIKERPATEDQPKSPHQGGPEDGPASRCDLLVIVRATTPANYNKVSALSFTIP